MECAQSSTGIPISSPQLTLKGEPKAFEACADHLNKVFYWEKFKGKVNANQTKILEICIPLTQRPISPVFDRINVWHNRQIQQPLIEVTADTIKIHITTVCNKDDNIVIDTRIIRFPSN